MSESGESRRGPITRLRIRSLVVTNCLMWAATIGAGIVGSHQGDVLVFALVSLIGSTGTLAVYGAYRHGL